MSLSQLLVVGKSLEGGKDEPNPYRMTEQHQLPKFASVGRPVSLAPAPKPFAAAAERFFASRKARQPFAAAPAAVAAPVAPARGAVAQPRRGLARLNPFASRKAAQLPLVQAELSLDAVRVVRNDLSDADLELIPVEPAAPVEAAAPGPAPAKPERRPTVWSRLTARLFSLGRAWH